MEVAKIEGTPEYKRFMRETQERDQTTDTPLCSLLGLCPQSPDVAAAAGMLRSLKTAVEYYLGTTFCYADVVITDPSIVYQSSVIAGAINAVGLRRVGRAPELGSAAAVAVVANRLSPLPEVPETDREHLVLVVEYSRASLNTVLFSDNEYGILLSIRQGYYPHLGAESKYPDDKRWEKIKVELEEIVRPPFGRSVLGPVELPDHIENLVLHGELARDRDLRDTLTTVLGSRLVDDAQVFDPVFASSVGTSQIAVAKMDTPEFYFHQKAAFLCKWRSGLYSSRTDEL